MNTRIALIIIFYGIIDIITTYVALTMGYSEQNPIGLYLLGHGMIVLIIAKVVAIALIYLFYRACIYFKIRWYWSLISSLIILLGIVIMINNSMVILGCGLL